MVSLFWICFLFFGFLSLFFDIYYFIYGSLVIIVSYIRRKFHKKHILEESVHYGICLPQDLDFWFHMNNARYLRECDFGRFIIYAMTDIHKAARQLGGFILTGASTIRYRRSIEFLNPYRVCSKIIGWDEKAFYFEQRLERPTDGFVYAIATVRQNVTKVSPQDIVEVINGGPMESPPLPDEILKWIECNQISSEKLRSRKDD